MDQSRPGHLVFPTALLVFTTDAPSLLHGAAAGGCSAPAVVAAEVQ